MPNFVVDVFDSYNVYYSNFNICELKRIYKLLAFYLLQKL